MSMASSDLEFGREVGLMHEVLVMGRKVGADRRFWTALAEDEELFQRVVAQLDEHPSYYVTIDHRRTLAELIHATGVECTKFNLTLIQGTFSTRSRAMMGSSLNIALFRFYADVSSDECVLKMEKRGYRPARIDELLDLIRCHPELRGKSPIIALGSVWESREGGEKLERVPAVMHDAVRTLTALAVPQPPGLGKWNRHCRFAAVQGDA